TNPYIGDKPSPGSWGLTPPVNANIRHEATFPDGPGNHRSPAGVAAFLGSERLRPYRMPISPPRGVARSGVRRRDSGKGGRPGTSASRFGLADYLWKYRSFSTAGWFGEKIRFGLVVQLEPAVAHLFPRQRSPAGARVFWKRHRLPHPSSSLAKGSRLSWHEW